VGSGSENRNSASRPAKGRPDFEKICIRFDDGSDILDHIPFDCEKIIE